MPGLKIVINHDSETEPAALELVIVVSIDTFIFTANRRGSILIHFIAYRQHKGQDMAYIVCQAVSETISVL